MLKHRNCQLYFLPGLSFFSSYPEKAGSLTMVLAQTQKQPHPLVVMASALFGLGGVMPTGAWGNSPADLGPTMDPDQPCNLASAPFSCGSGPVLPMQGPVQKTQQEPQPSMHQYQGCCLKTQLRTQQQPGDPFSTLFDCEPRGNPISPGA